MAGFCVQVDSDGHISREDLAKIVAAVYELMGNDTDSPATNDPIGRAEIQRKHVDRILEARQSLVTAESIAN